MIEPTPIASSMHSGNAQGEEQFLYIYLSLMICIFSLLFVLSTPAKKMTGQKKKETLVATQPVKKSPPSRFEGVDPILVELPFALFEGDSAVLEEESVQNLLTLLHSHNVRALITLPTTQDEAPTRYAQAVSLQRRFFQEGMSSEDTLVDVHISKNAHEHPILRLHQHEPLDF
ncbi:MAG: hypothetical protein KDD60_05580 [Bdellovibrionales bacterium]|nr:hypothetical protein [Bdellovibrionales bacterium]